MRSLLLITSFAVAVSGAAVAAQPVIRLQQENFLASKPHQDEATYLLDKLTQHFFSGCKEVRDNASKTVIFKPLVFDAAGKITGGFWKEQYEAAGCSAKKTFNVYFQVDKTGEVQALAGLNGTTIANLVLQRDTGQRAFLAAAKGNPSCKNFIVSDTRFDNDLPLPAPSAPPAPAVRHMWHETWTVSGCDQAVDVPLLFIEADSGTSIVPDMNGIVEHKE